MVAMDAAPAGGVVLDARGEPTFSHLTTYAVRLLCCQLPTCWPHGCASTCSDAEICAALPYQLFCQFPALSPFYLHIEKTFVRVLWCRWLHMGPAMRG